MSLVTRLTAFFLTALAVVLVGFSLALHLLVRTYLFGQADARLDAALATLAAAVESEPAGLQWEGDERRLALGRDDGAEQARWEVRDLGGSVVDRSPNLHGKDLGPAEPFAATKRDVLKRALPNDVGEPWLVGQQRITWEGDVKDLQLSAHGQRDRKYAGLILTAGIALGPIHATVRILALTLAGLSLGLWLSAALVGRWLCRRALAPVAQMAAAARDMGTADLSQRLPGPATTDELGALHRAFNGLLDRLHETFERQRRFTGDASHQLRTPLAAMLGQLDLALRRDRPPQEYHRTLAAVHTQADRLRQIVEALLFLARADVEAGLGELETVDLTAWLPNHLKSWETHVRTADLRVEVRDNGPLLVQAQPVLLGQLVDNLLDNAFKHSTAGAAVTVRLRRDADAAELAVQDAGSGIASVDLPHVFEPFYRAAEARRLGLAGAGLGLAVARRIATALGGTLAVESEAGNGSRFMLRLPVVRTE